MLINSCSNQNGTKRAPHIFIIGTGCPGSPGAVPIGIMDSAASINLLLTRFVKFSLYAEVSDRIY